ncbi:MAG: SIR2 family protein [Eubacteriales bacterium]|nr:SIR2 family protein [Eubacteriales bacterium]
MTIFISFAPADKKLFTELAERLKKRGHIVYPRSGKHVIPHLFNSIKEEISESDVFVALITEHYSNSKTALMELNTAVFTRMIRILPFISGNASVPVSVAKIICGKADTEEEMIAKVMSCVTLLEDSEKKALSDDRNQAQTPIRKSDAVQPEIYDTETKIAALQKAFADNRLTLVCGAGISRDSSIPTWDDLLVRILNDIYSEHDSPEPDDKVSAEYLLSLFPDSNLILGKYLRILLADDFERIVQKHLYAEYNLSRGLRYSAEEGFMYDEAETPILKAIVALARPEKSGSRLDSIITFNFDDLIEKALEKHSIDYTSIWKEGQSGEPDQLPVFHVHGFLPNQEDLDTPNLVFSEEAYHSQFIDPYSWANLTQLNAFSTNVCLFTGISLSDPDLRRLLDIVWRRNHTCRHYIIMKKSDRKSKTDEIANMLFEQDAYLLGLNVIWCNDFSEIPAILSRIAGADI